MSLSVTWTEIANLALTRINEERLGSISDDTVMAERIRDIREQVSSEVLEEHDWGSATKRAVLAAKAGEPDGLWLEHYAIPSDFVRCTAVWPTSLDSDDNVVHNGPPRHDWKMEGATLYVGQKHTPYMGSVLTTSTAHAMAYVAYNDTDLGQWSPSLRRCIALKLAIDLAVGTSGGVKFQNYLDGVYQRELDKARRMDTSREGNELHVYSNQDHHQPLRQDYRL